MDEPERTPDNPWIALTKLFAVPPDKPARRWRKYVLELQDGQPVFRCTDRDPTVERSEIEIAITETIDELFGNEIVPQKLAKHFPGPLRARGNFDY
jgi:hypothetical protein